MPDLRDMRVTDHYTLYTHTARIGADVLALEDRGLAMTTTALRVAYAAGGDGEVRLRYAPKSYPDPKFYPYTDPSPRP